MRIGWLVVFVGASVFAAQVSEVKSSNDKGYKEIRVLHQVDELTEPLAFEDTICLLRDVKEQSEACGKPVRILRKSRGWNEFVLKLPKGVADFSDGDKVILEMRRSYGGGSSSRITSRKTAGLVPREETTTRRRISRSVKRRLAGERGNNGRMFNIAAGGAVVAYTNFTAYAFQVAMQLAVSPEFAIGVTPLFLKQTVNGMELSGYGGFGTATIHFNRFFDGARLQAGAGYIMAKATQSFLESRTNTFAGFGTIGFAHAADQGISIDVGLGALYLANTVNSWVVIPNKILGYGTVAIGFCF